MFHFHDGCTWQSGTWHTRAWVGKESNTPPEYSSTVTAVRPMGMRASSYDSDPDVYRCMYSHLGEFTSEMFKLFLKLTFIHHQRYSSGAATTGLFCFLGGILLLSGSS